MLTHSKVCSPQSIIREQAYSRQNKKPRPHGFRWLLVLLFVGGYVATVSRFQGFAEEYTVLTAFSIAACSLLLWRLKRPLQVTLPFWVILAVFVVGYYLKFYWIALSPEMLEGYPGVIAASAYSSATLLSAYTLTTIAFATFCSTSWLLLSISLRRSSNYEVETHNKAYQSVAKILLVIVPTLMLATFMIAYSTGIAVMGLKSVYLPFRLAGIISYGRLMFIPALLLMLIWCSQRAGSVAWRTRGVVLLFLHGISEVILRTSRGELAVLLLLLGFLLLTSSGRLKRSEMGVLFAVLSITAIFAPIFSEYRYYRIANPTESALVALDRSMRSSFKNGPGFVELFAQGASLAVLRVTGVEMLLAYTGLGVSPLGSSVLAVIASPRGVAGYVTQDILGYPSYAIHTSAVSLVGWFYLVGGEDKLVIVAMAGFCVAVWGLWRLLARLRLHSLPVAQALFLSWVYSLATEGLLDAQGVPFLIMAVSIIVCEWLIRFVGRSEASVTRLA